VTGHQPPRWERIGGWLVVSAVSLQVLANVLPRLLVPIVVLAGVFAVVRIVLFYTQKW
jgi:hypothetical protein